jgi:hypothetical protein
MWEFEELRVGVSRESKISIFDLNRDDGLRPDRLSTYAYNLNSMVILNLIVEIFLNLELRKLYFILTTVGLYLTRNWNFDLNWS